MNPLSIGLILPAVLAVTAPLLLAPSVSPTSTFLNQLVAFAGCCFWLLTWAGSLTRSSQPAKPPGAGWAAVPGASRLMVAVLLVLALLQGVSFAPLGQRWVPVVSMLLAAALAAAAGGAALRGDDASFWRPLMVALLLAGGLSVAVSVVQVFVPGWTDGVLVAFPTAPGRAIGNMRQPNQLSTLLMWACAAAVWLTVRRHWHWGVLAALLAALVLTVVATASRTGTVGVLMLALWGAVDRRLPGRVRLLMLASLPVYVLGWWGLEQWANHTGIMFYGDDQVRKTLHGDASSSRGRIWGNTLAMISRHPWFGVGPGAFNFNWSMTVFPDRPVAFFDHSHNLVLQLAVESGVPLTLGVLCALGLSLWLARGAFNHPDEARARQARTAGFMLALVAVHSLLEYPLWYIYFLLPTALLAGSLTGLAVRREAESTEAWAVATPPAEAQPHRLLRARIYCAAAALGLAGSAWALYEYYTVAVIFEPDLALGTPAPLARRIEVGQRSVLFGHHADYALVTMAAQPETVWPAFRRPLYHLLDTRLMTAYARALAGRGEIERARHVAARLREFNNPQSAEFFAVCDSAAKLPEPERPFQCRSDPRLDADALRP